MNVGAPDSCSLARLLVDSTRTNCRGRSRNLSQAAFSRTGDRLVVERELGPLRGGDRRRRNLEGSARDCCVPNTQSEKYPRYRQDESRGEDCNPHVDQHDWLVLRREGHNHWTSELIEFFRRTGDLPEHDSGLRYPRLV